MKIAVRKESNGTIYIDTNLRPEITYTEPPYNFTIVEIDDIYNDCEGVDFNENLQFDVIKYNNRKLKTTSLNRITELKAILQATDYKAIKFAEGLITAEEYAPIKAQRQEWRDEINRLEEEIK